MKKETYRKMIAFSGRTKFRREVIVRFCKRTPLLILAIYIGFITFLALIQSTKIILFLAVPAVDFLFITFLRATLNRPRPFEVFQIDPLLPHKRGKSFPSRHTASAFIIGMACLYINITFGILVLVMAAIVGFTRILTGLHFTRDVIFSALFSLILGALGFFVLGHFIFV